MSLGFTGFGQPTTSAPPAFGTAASTLNFGGPTQASSPFGAQLAAPISSTGLNFGGQLPTSSVAPLNFSSTAPTSAFGGTATTGISNAFAGFGTPASVATGLPNFGAPASSATSLFGAPPASTTTTSMAGGFAGFGGFGGTATTPAAQPSLGGLFGNTSTAANTGGLFGNKAFGAPASSAPASTATTFTGLGGPAVTLTSSAGGLGSDQQKQDKAVKDQELPAPILESIEEFKAFVKQQKNISSDITRSSCRPSERVDDDIENIKQNLFSIRNHIQSYSTQAKKLKAESSRTLGHAEMAQQTQDIVPSMQDKHLAPDDYFVEVVNEIEEELHLISQEVDSVERVVHTATESSALKKEELVQAVKRLHEIFITVASKLQQVHSTVDQKKEQYLLLRHQYMHDTTDVFQSLQKPKQGMGVGGLLGGPSLFGSLKASPSVAAASAPVPVRPTFAPSLSYGGMPTPLPVAETTPFQLQQPPIGNKRNKH